MIKRTLILRIGHSWSIKGVYDYPYQCTINVLGFYDRHLSWSKSHTYVTYSSIIMSIYRSAAVYLNLSKDTCEYQYQ